MRNSEIISILHSSTCDNNNKMHFVITNIALAHQCETFGDIVSKDVVLIIHGQNLIKVESNERVKQALSNTVRIQ